MKASKQAYGISLGVFLIFIGFMIVGCEQNSPSAALSNPIGKVDLKSTPEKDFQPAKDRDPINPGGAVRTGESGMVNIVFPDKSEITVKPESYFELGAGELLGQQKTGTVLYRFEKQKIGVRIKTPHGLTTVLGTTFALEVGSQSTVIYVEEGTVAFKPLNGEQKNVTRGQQLIVSTHHEAPEMINVDPLKPQQTFQPGDENLKLIDIDPFKLRQIFHPGEENPKGINQH